MAITDEELGRAIQEDRCVLVYFLRSLLVDVLNWCEAPYDRYLSIPHAEIPSDAHVLDVYWDAHRNTWVAVVFHPSFEPTSEDGQRRVIRAHGPCERREVARSDFPGQLPKSCPFCGQLPQVHVGEANGRSYATVKCENPHCRAWPAVKFVTGFPDDIGSKGHAIRRWNERPKP